MTNKTIGHFDLIAAKRAYANGENITEMLRAQQGITANTPQIIETAYDLQAGTYIDWVRSNQAQVTSYAIELAAILDRFVDNKDTLLDVGAGELTTLSALLPRLVNKPRQVFAFDISWSRIHVGLEYAQENMGSDFQSVVPFVADMAEIPLLDKSIDITTSSHALEPNGERLGELLSELFRVTKRLLVLFEPSYETNSPEGRLRMDRLGYIKDVTGEVSRLGGTLVERISLSNVANPLNPTNAFIIKPPVAIHSQPSDRPSNGDEVFSVPGTNYPLTRVDNIYYSKNTGLCFPIIKTIPVLKTANAILASALDS